MSISSARGTSSAVGRLSERQWRCTSRMSPSPASRTALLLVAVLCLLAGVACPLPAAAQRVGDDIATIHDRCVAFVRGNPKAGLERARLWKDQGGGFAAD